MSVGDEVWGCNLIRVGRGWGDEGQGVRRGEGGGRNV